ncbi:unnamed protein product [Musa textilis]
MNWPTAMLKRPTVLHAFPGLMGCQLLAVGRNNFAKHHCDCRCINSCSWLAIIDWQRDISIIRWRVWLIIVNLPSWSQKSAKMMEQRILSIALNHLVETVVSQKI